ncbi:RHS repeat-associated core domain-containing protein [Oscillochloris sp. ZM17-4]|uniref:RHS repeat domain-containing protein n=1 Tax=Oscillochloris sp. ZM17-4 TaxID=2866714 RepID=UPI001C72E288|nr:RHS repeat-associated core domain-containing protein [Oscillochloris sp. ZM17-4]MBX0329999.1 RHS repeat-associated core domain-containing protein [Oscillochloris sp. ZM17-4]
MSPSLNWATTRTITYAYDGLSRLTGATEAGATSNSYAYSYDLAGNRTSATINGVTTSRSYNVANQVQGWSYDNAGNLLSDGTTTYTYDALGRTLTQGSTSYSYNGDGVLVQAGATHYTQDLASPLSQILSDPSTGLGAGGSANYLYGLDRLASSAGAWYLGDALGSVRQTLNASGAVLSTASYDPWGTPTSGMIAPFGFTGELQDSAGQVYLRARWYNATHGTFTSRDPFEGYLTRPGSLHPYHYVYQNPILWTDPTGYDMDAMSYFLWGIVAQFAYNNGNLVPEARAKLAPTSCEPFPMMVGRHVGNIATTLQGLAEITAGSGGMAGGGGLCITGVGCLAGAPLAVASAAVAAHGVAVVGQAGASEIELIVYTIMGGGGGNRGPGLPANPDIQWIKDKHSQSGQHRQEHKSYFYDDLTDADYRDMFEAASEGSGSI